MTVFVEVNWGEWTKTFVKTVPEETFALFFQMQKKKTKKGQYFNLFANMRLLTHLDNIISKQLMDNADEYQTLKWQAYNNTLTFYFYTNYTLVKIGGIHAYSTIWNKVICHHCTTSLWVFFYPFETLSFYKCI